MKRIFTTALSLTLAILIAFLGAALNKFTDDDCGGAPLGDLPYDFESKYKLEIRNDEYVSYNWVGDGKNLEQVNGTYLYYEPTEMDRQRFRLYHLPDR